MSHSCECVLLNTKSKHIIQKYQLESSCKLMFYIPYFTDYKTHFFLRKIASKIQVRLILEINIKNVQCLI
jgi:hypothetical protein